MPHQTPFVRTLDEWEDYRLSRPSTPKPARTSQPTKTFSPIPSCESVPNTLFGSRKPPDNILRLQQDTESITLQKRSFQEITSDFITSINKPIAVIVFISLCCLGIAIVLFSIKFGLIIV